MSRVLKIVIGLCIVIACAAAGLYGTGTLLSGEESGTGREGSAQQATRVGVTSPEMRSIEDAVSAVGTLMPVRSVALVPNAPGRVTEVPVSSGEDVAEGELLIQLDDRAERAALSDAEATLSEAQQEFNRVEELAQSNAAAEARLEEARATLSRAEAAAMTARAQLEDKAIIAPFAGTLGLIDIEPGAFLDGSEAVTSLSDLSVVEVDVSLPERYFERVTPDQTLFVTTPAYPGETFQGPVTVRAPEIDLGSRSFNIRAEIDNADRRLVGGMFANSRLVLDTYEGLAIPDDAIISEGLTTYVYTIEDGSASRTEIQTCASLGDLTEVSDGLEAGDRVVVAGWDQLTDGAPVEIDEEIASEGLE